MQLPEGHKETASICHKLWPAAFLGWQDAVWCLCRRDARHVFALTQMCFCGFVVLLATAAQGLTFTFNKGTGVLKVRMDSAAGLVRPSADLTVP
jgi:hypothetical protein